MPRKTPTLTFPQTCMTASFYDSACDYPTACFWPCAARMRTMESRGRMARKKPKVVKAAAHMWFRIVFDFDGKATVKECLREPGL